MRSEDWGRKCDARRSVIRIRNGRYGTGVNCKKITFSFCLQRVVGFSCLLRRHRPLRPAETMTKLVDHLLLLEPLIDAEAPDDAAGIAVDETFVVANLVNGDRPPALLVGAFAS